MSDLSEVKDRLTALETLAEERWDNHDKRSDERWQGVKELLDKIDGYILAAPDRKEKCMEEAKRHANAIVGWTLGVPGTVTLIIGFIVLVHKLMR